MKVRIDRQMYGGTAARMERWPEVGRDGWMDRRTELRRDTWIERRPELDKRSGGMEVWTDKNLDVRHDR